MGKRGTKPRPLIDRFEEKFIRLGEDDCWEWAASFAGRGYGQIQVGTKKSPKMAIAPRVAYELYIGPIPDGMHVCHTCDNKKCVNPKHLVLGTNAENHRQVVERQRGRKSKKGLLPYVVFDTRLPLPWRAKVHIDRETVHLGGYTTEEQAHNAAMSKLREHHGF